MVDKMRTEFEVKILDIDVAKITEKLKYINAIKVSDNIMRRYVYDFHSKNFHSWIRLRDEGGKVTLCIKEIHNDKIEGTKETEIEVGNFEDTNTILNKLGYYHKSYQENRRVSYRLGKTHIEIDYWPRIPPYLEIEGDSVDVVEKTVKILGFELSQTTSINTIKVYKKYGLILEDIKELRL